ncbi:hypothetical protein FOVSG1_005619 [Fusarium oxysporum f. sp. vasinfectum]
MQDEVAISNTIIMSSTYDQSSWVGDDQRIPAVVCFLLDVCLFLSWASCFRWEVSSFVHGCGEHVVDICGWG